MRYKVYDTWRKCFVTDDPCIILKPDGRLAVNEYGDETGIPHCIALFYPTDNDDYYIDEVGGVHDSGGGWAPDGSNCGECSNISCKICGVWNKTKFDNGHYQDHLVVDLPYELGEKLTNEGTPPQPCVQNKT